MDTPEQNPDFTTSRFDLGTEIKGQIILLNDAISNARTAMRFSQNRKPSSFNVYSAVYKHTDRLVGLTREILSEDLVKKVDNWLDNGNLTNYEALLKDAIDFKRKIDQELYELGLKDTKIRLPVPYPIDFYDKKDEVKKNE